MCDLLGAHSDYKSESPPTTKLIKTSDCTFIIIIFVPVRCAEVRITKSTEAVCVSGCISVRCMRGGCQGQQAS